jgi:hypothetical protein
VKKCVGAGAAAVRGAADAGAAGAGAAGAGAAGAGAGAGARAGAGGGGGASRPSMRVAPSRRASGAPRPGLVGGDSGETSGGVEEPSGSIRTWSRGNPSTFCRSIVVSSPENGGKGIQEEAPGSRLQVSERRGTGCERGAPGPRSLFQEPGSASASALCPLPEARSLKPGVCS